MIDDVKEKLESRARRHGRSAEEEIREGSIRAPMGSRIAARFRRVGLDKEIP